jgi:DHA3 family macrolide efflux protein-like MFS transporter
VIAGVSQRCSVARPMQSADAAIAVVEPAAICCRAQLATVAGCLVGAAVAAYTLPGVLGTLTLGRWLRGRSGAQLADWDAVLPCVALAAVPLAAALGLLTIGLLVALLVVSSVLDSWGSAGKYTLLTELLPQRDQLAGNALVATVAELTTVVGPLLAGSSPRGAARRW